MENEALKTRITEWIPSATFEETGEWLNVVIETKDWLTLALHLHKDEALFFDYLFCLTCIDWKTHLMIVCHLSSTRYRHNIVLKTSLPVNNPAIETVSYIWKTADFHEREVYEMFGVKFINHPDLRLLILPDGWEGRNPMRKDFEDAINMIKL
jgi:NADH-quinone oxidoreductase subunit C